MPDALPARLTPDTYQLILAALSTVDVLACAQVCTALRQLCEANLLQAAHALRLRCCDVTGPQLLWLASERMRGQSSHIDISGCEHITKVQVVAAVEASPKLHGLACLRVGPGSWSAKQCEKLLAASPDTLESIELDLRLELKNDLHEGSATLSALAANTVLRVTRLTLIADNVSNRPTPGGDDVSDTAAATAAMAAATLGDEEAAGLHEQADDDAQDDDGEATVPAEVVSPELCRLGAALISHAPRLLALDASSGALCMGSAGPQVLAPLLAAPRCALDELSACNLPRGVMRSLAPAIRSNGTLRTLLLNSNMLYGQATRLLAGALEGHASLTHLSLEHNPIRDAGGAALAAVVASTRIATLSLRFTGVADRTCESLGLALATERCRLRALLLGGNGITSAGVAALAASLGPLRTLDLSANLRMDETGACELARELAGSSLTSLRLAGCKVGQKGCSRLAAALLRSELRDLDLSANHFGNGGSDEFAWVLAECEALTSLNLADCDIDDEGADELHEALSETAPAAAAAGLRHLDLRWNKLSAPKHQRGAGISADPRVDATSQKQVTAADRQTAYLEQTWQQAKAAGKKAPPPAKAPKWVREQQKRTAAAQAARGAGSGGTGSAIG